jgi:hypothetical protein
MSCWNLKPNEIQFLICKWLLPTPKELRHATAQGFIVTSIYWWHESGGGSSLFHQLSLGITTFIRQSTKIVEYLVIFLLVLHYKDILESVMMASPTLYRRAGSSRVPGLRLTILGRHTVRSFKLINWDRFHSLLLEYLIIAVLPTCHQVAIPLLSCL